MLLPAPYGTGLEHVAREPLSIAQVSPQPWGVTHEINEFVDRVSAGLAERGHRSSWRRRPARGRPCASRAGRSTARAGGPAALFDGAWKGDRAGGDGGPPVLAVGSSICDAARPADRGPLRCRSTSAGRSRTCSAAWTSTSSTSTIRSRRARLGRPAPLALAERRHLPRADGARPLDPGRAAAGGDLLRAARCPHGQLPRHVGADGALLPRLLRAGRARCGSGVERLLAGRPANRGTSGPVRIAFCLEEERGALRLFLRALRRLPLEPRLGGGGLDRRTPTEVRLAQAAARPGPRPGPAARRRRRS